MRDETIRDGVPGPTATGRDRLDGGAAPAGRTWIDDQPADVVEAAILQLRTEDPDAWTMFGGDAAPRYAVWASLVLWHTDGLFFPLAMNVATALRGAAGVAAYRGGLSPYGAAVHLSADAFQQTAPERSVPSGRSAGVVL